LIDDQFDCQIYALGIKDHAALFLEKGVGDSLIVRGWEAKELFKYGLLWARQGLTFEDLGLYLNMDPTTSSRRMEDWIDCLYPWAKKQILFPNLQEWILNNPEKLREQFPNHLFFFVDGTVIKIWTPSDPESRRNHYNNKHGYCAWVFFIVVDPCGHILFLSKLDIGHKHDSTHWNESKVVKLLTSQFASSDDWTYCIGGDKAYPNISLPPDWHLFVTMTAEELDQSAVSFPEHDVGTTASESSDEGHDATHDDGRNQKINRHKSPKIAKWRSVVERSIGAIKKWKILENFDFLSRVEGDKLLKLLHVICALVNWERVRNAKSW